MNCPYDQLEKTLVMLLQNKVDTFTIAIVAKGNYSSSFGNRRLASKGGVPLGSGSRGTSIGKQKVLVDYYIITWMSEEKL
jgi:hypothetical protein